MKKIISIGKVLLLTILFILGTANRCFADLYVSPNTEFTAAIPFLEATLIVLGVIFAIALVCMLVAKITNSKELLSKSKNICENLLYYILFVVGLRFAVYELIWVFILGVLSLIVVFVSLFLRLKSKNKKISYIVLGIYLGLTLLMLLSGLQYIF